MGLPELERILEEGNIEHYLAFAVPNIPEIQKGDDLGQIIYERMEELGGFANKDIIVVASKIVSKAEGRIIDVSSLPVSLEAEELSQKINKPPQVCQVILDQSTEYMVRHGTIIAKHKLGYILTSAGVDRVDDSTVSLIPQNPDLSATHIRERIEQLSGKELAVLISDSEGREDRVGAGAIALGVSGINPLRVTESVARNGRIKRAEETLSDLLSSAANVIIGQRGKQTPVVCIRGIKHERDFNIGVFDILHRQIV